MLVLEGGEEAEGWLTAAQEKGAIKNLLEATEEQLKEGDTFYLLAYRWWKQWQDYVEDDCNSNNPEPLAAYYFKSCDESISRRPPTIDNSELVVDPYTEDVEAQLQSTLVESQDYILVPEKVWKALHKWYGGGPVLPRKVIAMGAEQQIDLQVEVYPLQLRLVANPEGNQTIVNISKKETIACLYERVCKLFNLSFEQVRLWNYYGRTKHKLLGDFGQTLQDASLQMGQEILSEVCVNGKWPEDEVCLVNGYGSMGRNLSVLPSNNSCSTLSIAGGPIGSKVLENNSTMRHSLSPLDISKEDDTYYGGTSSSGRSGPKGLTGLHNLGNTCFMNSALQCLVHTPQLVEFFLQDYIKEINRENPLGMEGELAIAFGELLRKLWAPGRTPVAPRPFKTKLARFAPQFSGYNQHDSQELLAFLLDGLHEDLNRLKNKPYIEVKDVEGRSDEEVADEYWANHRARNDSIIVDVYQGQYKSTLVCPVCGEVSVTFDPFMYLSLPLPSKAARAMTVVVFCGDGSAPPTSYTINVPKQGKYKDLVNAIGGACSLQSDEKLLMIQLSGLRNFRLVEEPASISSIHDDDRLAAYRLPKVSDRQPLLVLLQHRSEDDYYSLSNAKQWRLFGLPLITCVREDRPCTGADVKAAVEQVLCPMKKPGRAQELDYRDNRSMHDEGPEMLEREPFSDKIPSNNGGTSSLCWEGHSPRRTPFLLSITDERGSSREILMDQHIISPVSSVRSNQRFRYFAVDWSDEALESQYDLSCIERLPEVCKADTPSTYKKARQEAVSLYNCLEAFLKEEPLGPEDMWYCPRCKEHRQASKKLDLWRLPEILVVHLKRFSYNRYLKNKLETFVNFPIHDLDLTRYVASKASSDHYLYDLYAVSNHYGSMGAGHYTAHAKLFDDNKWYNFDDNHVTPVNEDEIKTSAAYVLFYRRKHGEKGLKNDVINGCLEQRNFVDVSNQGKVNKPYSFGSGLENPRLLSVSATSNMMLD